MILIIRKKQNKKKTATGKKNRLKHKLSSKVYIIIYIRFRVFFPCTTFGIWSSRVAAINQDSCGYKKKCVRCVYYMCINQYTHIFPRLFFSKEKIWKCIQKMKKFFLVVFHFMTSLGMKKKSNRAHSRAKATYRIIIFFSCYNFRWWMLVVY